MKSLKSICLVTGDVSRLRHFYEVALGVNADGDDDFATFPSPAASLSIASVRVLGDMAPGLAHEVGAGGCFLEFEVEDVDDEHDRLLALDVEVVKPPTTQPWGLRSVWFRDPDGNLINFFARIDGRHVDPKLPGRSRD